MKCDKLNYKMIRVDGKVIGVCMATEVDEAIAELKQELEDAKATAYAESVDAGMENRRLKRALYNACAMWADRTRLICSVFGSDAPRIRWERMLGRCRAKAEEYK